MGKTARDLTPGYTEMFVQTDAGNNIYFSGVYTGNCSDFDPVRNCAAALRSNNGVFLLKLDASGILSQQKIFATGPGSTSVDACIKNSSPSGEIYAGGEFRGTVDFDPGVGTITRSSPGNYNYYVLHTSMLRGIMFGHRQERQQPAQCSLRAGSVNAAKQVLITGRFEGTNRF